MVALGVEGGSWVVVERERRAPLLPCRKALPRDGETTRHTPARIKDRRIGCRNRCCCCYRSRRALLRWRWRSLYWGFGFAALRLSCEDTRRREVTRAAFLLLRDPTPPSAVPFRTYFSPRLGAQSEQLQYLLQYGHANVCEEIERQLRIPARPINLKSLRGRDCKNVPFLDGSHRSILCFHARLPTHRSLYGAF